MVHIDIGSSNNSRRVETTPTPMFSIELTAATATRAQRQQSMRFFCSARFLAKGVLTGCLFIALGACAMLSTQRIDRESEHISDQIYELLAADLSLHYGDKEQSLEHYYKAALLSNDIQVYRATIAIAVSSNAYRKAADIAERWYRSDADNLELNGILALIYIELKNYRRALTHIEFALSQDLSVIDKQAFVQMFTMRSVDDSMAVINELEKFALDKTYILLLRAYVTFFYGSYEQALEAIARALLLTPKLDKAILLKADILFALNKNQAGLDWLASQAALHQDSFNIQAKAATIFQHYGHEVPAARFYQTAYQLNSDDVTFTLEFALFNLTNKQFARAADLLDRYRSLGGDAEATTYYRGLLAERRGDLDAALNYYQAVSSDAIRQDAVVQIAKIYQSQGKLELAKEQFDRIRAHSRGPDEKVQLYIVQADAMKEAGLAEQALQLYDEALQQHPDSSSLMYSRGMLALKLDQFETFEQDMKRIIQSEPNNWHALNALGYTLADRNMQLQDARTYIRRAYQLNPTEPAILDSMGWIEFRLNNLELARYYVQKAASMTRHAEILGHLVEIFWMQQKQQQALELMDDALKEFPNDEYLLRLHRQLVQ